MPLSALLLPDGDLRRGCRAAAPPSLAFLLFFLIPPPRLEAPGQELRLLVCLHSPGTVGGVHGSALLNVGGK